jgi:hypothetical protein
MPSRANQRREACPTDGQRDEGRERLPSAEGLCIVATLPSSHPISPFDLAAKIRAITPVENDTSAS